jgi:hypothetical protein
MGVSTGRKKTLVKSQNSPLSTNVVQLPQAPWKLKELLVGLSPLPKHKQNLKKVMFPRTCFAH